jgi:hypothetical protein
MVARSVTLDCSIQPSPANNPYTLIMTAFDQGDQAKFTFTLWYKNTDGARVTLEEF